jgi:DHA1 family tetracycline resistance protein-like MFS transporter
MKRSLFPGNATMAFILVTAALDMMAMGIVIPVLPKLIQQLAGSNAQAGVISGMLVALWSLLQFGASPLIGSLSDRYGRRPIIVMSALGLAIDYVIIALSSNLWWLAIGRVIAGVTSASFTTVNAYVADVSLPNERARSYGLIGAACSVGLVAGPLLGGMLGELSTRAPFWAAGALSVLAFFYGLFFLPESLCADRRMPFSWKRANPLGSMSLLRSHYELSGLALVNLLTGFGSYVFVGVLALYASYRYGWSSWEVGALFAMLGVLDISVQATLVAPIVRRLGDRGTMVLGLLAGGIGFVCMGLAPTGLWFIFAVIPSALAGLAAPTLQSLMTRCVSQSEQGQLQGANMSLAGIAGTVAPMFFGFIYSISLSNRLGGHTYPGAAFLTAAVVFLAAGVVGWIVVRRVKSRIGLTAQAIVATATAARE